MKLLIFKTNIESRQAVKQLAPVFRDLPVEDWCVDLWDIDKVLRIEADEHLSEAELFNKLESRGIYCEELPD